MEKPFWTSKTFWVNLVALAASVLAGFGLGIDATTQAAIVGGVLAVINLGLRAVTKKKLTSRS